MRRSMEGAYYYTIKPFWRFLHPWSYITLNNEAEYLKSAASDLIAQRQQHPHKEQRDMLDILLHAEDKRGQRLTSQEVLDNLLSIL